MNSETILIAFLSSGAFSTVVIQIMGLFKNSKIEKTLGNIAGTVAWLKAAEETRQHNEDLLKRIEAVADDDMKMFRSDALRCFVAGATREFIAFVKTVLSHAFKGSCNDLGVERLREIFKWQRENIVDVVPEEFVRALWLRIDELNSWMLNDYTHLIKNPLNNKSGRFEILTVNYVQQFNVAANDIYNEFVDLNNFRTMVQAFKENENGNN